MLNKFRLEVFFTVAFGMLLITPSVLAEEHLKDNEVAKSRMSTGRYVTGGVIGTVFGFGIGHAIQGRYMPLGLVFSVGEAAGYAAFFADTKFGIGSFGGVTTVRTIDMGALGVIGLIVASGLHIWEVIDLWVTGAELRRSPVADNGPRLMIVPTVMHNEAPAVVMALRF